MNKKNIARIRSLRLRTLPLSLSGVCLGLLLAAGDFKISLLTAAMTLLTTICLQILSNLSNELGDSLSGTDGEDRQGPNYGMDSGTLSKKDMKKMIATFILLSVVFGLAMILSSFGSLLRVDSFCLIFLGALAILAAVGYTLGRNPYGYKGLGDLSVFIFFGLASVLGSYYVAAHTIPSWLLVLPASAIGFFCVGVLNVNNIRDIRTDAATRITVAMKLGVKRARIYQTVLVCLGWICMLAFCAFRESSYLHWTGFKLWHLLFILSLPLFIIHLKGVWTKMDKDLDPMLPLLVISTFCFALLGGVGFLL